MGSYHDIYDAHIEKIRFSEYPSLLKTTYLDHAGTTLYAKSLIDEYHKDLISNLYGNPHSESPASWLATQSVDEARLAVLNYLNADADHFDVVFAANATAAIKVVADCFRDQDFWYGYHKDAHNSIVGVREVAKLGSRCFKSNDEVENWIKQDHTTSKLRLFAYPAQSNMTGYRLPYSWCQQLRAACTHGKKNTYVLLDAASYLTSGRLDLSNPDTAPDFVALSFYKIFGYPDLGALLVKKSAFDVLTQRRYFGGGTVEQVTVMDAPFHVNKRQTIHDFLEDGTLPFHSIVALRYAISIHNQLFGTAKNISRHTAHISAWLYEQLNNLKHANGKPVVEIHKDPNATYGDPKTQGPIVAFNVLRDDGSFVGKSHIEKLAIECGFQIRTGGVCNPGGVASMLRLKHWELRRNFTEGGRCGDDIDVIGAKPTGIIRASLGPMSTKSDVMRFVDFMREFFVETSVRSISDHLSRTSITPIEGCDALVIDATDYAAYQLWDQQWCVIDLDSGKPIKAIRDMHATIDVNSEKLILACSGKEFALSLWDVPKAPAIPSTAAERYFDLYQGADINTWLSSMLGFKCAFARYRREDIRLSPEATTCVVTNCASRQHTNQNAIRLHYKSHAKAFLLSHPLDINRRPSTINSWKDTLFSWNRSTTDLVKDRQRSSTGSTAEKKERRRSSTIQFIDGEALPVIQEKSTNIMVQGIEVVPNKLPGAGKNRRLAFVSRAFGMA